MDVSSRAMHTTMNATIWFARTFMIVWYSKISALDTKAQAAALEDFEIKKKILI